MYCGAFKMDDTLELVLTDVTASLSQAMVSFLKSHEAYTGFLLENFEKHGLCLGEEPNSANFKAVFLKNEMMAVFALTRRGTLLVQSRLQQPIFDLILQACQKEPIKLKGVIGEWDFCFSFWEFLKQKNEIRDEIFVGKEVLYSLDLAKLTLSSCSQIRNLTENDYLQWRRLRLKYLEEENFPQDLSEKQLFEYFLEKSRDNLIWGYFFEKDLVSIAGLNAKVFGVGTVGGVYTDPPFRRKGYAFKLMQQLSLDCREKLGLHKLIIFTGENNLPAQKLYESLGVTLTGHYALLFAKE